MVKQSIVKQSIVKRKFLSWKWSPANKLKEHDRSELKNKYNVTSNEITSLVLDEGLVVHETKRESNHIKMGNRELIGTVAPSSTACLIS